MPHVLRINLRDGCARTADRKLTHISVVTTSAWPYAGTNSSSSSSSTASTHRIHRHHLEPVQAKVPSVLELLHGHRPPLVLHQGHPPDTALSDEPRVVFQHALCAAVFGGKNVPGKKRRNSRSVHIPPSILGAKPYKTPTPTYERELLGIRIHHSGEQEANILRAR